MRIGDLKRLFQAVFEGYATLQNGVRIYFPSTAITANVTTTTAPAGSFAVTSNATGLGIIFKSDGSKWQTTAGAGSGPANTDALTEGSTNLYFTAARVRATVLTGLSTAAGTVVTTSHSVLQAIGFLQKQVSDLRTDLTAIAGSTIQVVASTQISTETVLNQILYTVPAGTRFIPLGLIFRDANVSMAAADASSAVGFEEDPVPIGGVGNMSANLFTGLTSPDRAFYWAPVVPNAIDQDGFPSASAIFKIGTAGQTLKIGLGFGVETGTIEVDVLGILLDA